MPTFVCVESSRLHDGIVVGRAIEAQLVQEQHEAYLYAADGGRYPAVFFRDTIELERIDALAAEIAAMLGNTVDVAAIQAAARRWNAGTRWLYVIREQVRTVARFKTRFAAEGGDV